MKKLISKDLKWFILLPVFILFTVLLVTWPAEEGRMLNIQNYLITVGGIISAFMITYLATKIYNLRAERQNRQIEIDKLGSRLTAFRKILYFVMNSRDFWIHYDDIAKFKRDFPNVNYETLNGNNEKDLPIRKRFYLDGYAISTSTITLYTSMVAIYGEADEVGIPFAMERMQKINYAIDDLLRMYYPANQIWYFLDGRYGKHGIGSFRDNGLNVLYLNSFNDLLAIASRKHRGQEFHRIILADIGADLHGNLIPEMLNLISMNNGIPIDLNRTFLNLVMIMLFGVIFPLFLQSLKVSPDLNVLITLSLVLITLLTLVNFLFDFYKIIRQEVHTNDI